MVRRPARDILYVLYARDSSPQHSGPPRNLTASIGPQGRAPDTLIAGARRRSIYYDTYILTRCTQKIIQKKITILMIIIIKNDTKLINYNILL